MHVYVHTFVPLSAPIPTMRGKRMVVVWPTSHDFSTRMLSAELNPKQEKCRQSYFNFLLKELKTSFPQHILNNTRKIFQLLFSNLLFIYFFKIWMFDAEYRTVELS